MSNQTKKPADGANGNGAELHARVSSGRAHPLVRRTFADKLSYSLRWVPAYTWQRITRPVPRGPVHLIIAAADHFEPAIVPEDGQARASYHEQERRLERWCQEYPKTVAEWHDCEGRPFVHTYFYPAEQYDRGLIELLAEHCHSGWGEIEVHLHHGNPLADGAQNTRRQLVEFRDTLASEHGCLSYLDGVGQPQYAFVHGNFALANSADGFACGVDGEMQVLAETGCYADMTLPTGVFHPAQIGKINSLYECALPLNQRAPHRKGVDLQRGRAPRIFPLIVQGPLMVDFASPRPGRIGIENGSLTGMNPPSMRRLELWKRAAIAVQGRPDWLFIKLHCHSMDPTQENAVLGAPTQRFLEQLVTGANERHESIHFVSAREMTNIIFAACDGREGNPGEYRDYRLKPVRAVPVTSSRGEISPVELKG
jgi:uncharacterized protein YuzB (UPF0349 family)